MNFKYEFISCSPKLLFLFYPFYTFKKILPNIGLFLKDVFNHKLLNNPLSFSSFITLGIFLLPTAYFDKCIFLFFFIFVTPRTFTFCFFSTFQTLSYHYLIYSLNFLLMAYLLFFTSLKHF